LTGAGEGSIATQSDNGPKVRVERLSKRFGKGSNAFLALEETSFEVADREFATVIGPSGCGKSTLFNILAGLTTPTTGHVLMDGTSIDAERGHVGYMMQRDCLMQWRTILGNVIIGLEVLGHKRKDAKAKARELIARFGLAGFEDRYPSALSGGMRQRAALLRTLLLDRDLLLLDEPFGALDAITRGSMQEWLLDIWSEYRRTVLFITHDIEEAIYLADRVFVMGGPPGRIVADIRVDLPRPRDYEQMVGLPEFGDLKQQLLHFVRPRSAGGDSGPRPVPAHEAAGRV
jgi:ABC-type nitrate/sulfonate/bicarbonate transport system ATPase subunit